MARNLLVADDSITIQKVVGITFAQEDFDITYVDNGEDAIKKTLELKPDIVLADIIMPQKNGYEVCETIKKDPGLAQTPVLLLAGTFETFDETRGKQVGADGYIIKPFESQHLIDKVNELLKKREEMPKVEIPPAPAEAPAVQPAPPPEQPSQPPFQTTTAPPVTPPPQVQGPIPSVAPPTTTPHEPKVSTPQPTQAAPTPPPKQPDVQTAPPETPARDKRMEPMLEFETPTPSAPHTAEAPKAPEVPEISESIALDEISTPEQQIDLASPAEFIMGATGAQEDIYQPPTSPERKEDVVEVGKPPTFDFVSGESDLKPEAPEVQEPSSQSPPFPDLGAPIGPEEIKTEPPKTPPTSMDQMTFKEPVLEKPAEPQIPQAPSFEQPSPIPTPSQEDLLKTRQISDEITSSTPTPPPTTEPSKEEPTLRIPDDQMEEIIRRVSQNIIEKIAWEIVPDMAERIIKEEIKRLTEEEKK